MKTFKTYITERQDAGGVNAMDDMTALFSFVKKSNDLTGSMKVDRRTINELITTLESMGYDAETHKEAIFFEKKGYYPIEVIFDNARTKASIHIAKQFGKS